MCVTIPLVEDTRSDLPERRNAGPGSTRRSGRAAPPSDHWALARWRLWYARMLRTSRTTSAEDILLSWLVRMPPNVWRLGSRPTAAEQERWPGRSLLTPDECWGPHELADEQFEALRAQYAQIPLLLTGNRSRSAPSSASPGSRPWLPLIREVAHSESERLGVFGERDRADGANDGPESRRRRSTRSPCPQLYCWKAGRPAELSSRPSLWHLRTPLA